MNTQLQPTSFHAFNLSLSLIRRLVPVVGRVEQRDRELGKQLRTAASSVALNLGEGRKRTGRDRLHLWRIASGSAEEVRVALHVAAAWGYVDDDDIAPALDALDPILAILWRLTHP